MRAQKKDEKKLFLMLFNKTRKKKIIAQVRIADSEFKRFKGLMLESKKRFNYALVFPLGEPGRLRASIHMLFVFFPIDVLWLDARKRVVDKREALAPFVLNATPKKAAAFIVELPRGKAEKTEINDLLGW